jgi:hypothetical protein
LSDGFSAVQPTHLHKSKTTANQPSTLHNVSCVRVWTKIVGTRPARGPPEIGLIRHVQTSLVMNGVLQGSCKMYLGMDAWHANRSTETVDGGCCAFRLSIWTLACLLRSGRATTEVRSGCI